MKPEALRSCKRLIVTPSTFNLNSEQFVNRLARFGSQPISSSEYWMDTQGKAMMMIQDKFKFPRTARVYNDKIFDANTFTANVYTAYLLAKKSQNLPGEDKWNPADIIAIRASQASSIINELANFNPARRNAQSRKLQEENAKIQARGNGGSSSRQCLRSRCTCCCCCPCALVGDAFA